jgi:hypothetical protein
MNVANLFSNDKLYMISLGVPYSAALFVELTHTMSVIIYAMSPLILSLTWVAKWIKVCPSFFTVSVLNPSLTRSHYQAKRPPPERMSPLHRVFDQGLEIFAAAQRERVPPEVAARLDRLEGRAERLKRVNHDLLQVRALRHCLLPSSVTPTLFSTQLPADSPACRRAGGRLEGTYSVVGLPQALSLTSPSPLPHLSLTSPSSLPRLSLIDALKEAFPPAAHPALARALRRIATEESLLLRDAEESYGGELVESGSWGNFAAVDADDDDDGGGDDKERGSRPGNGGGAGSNVADVALARSTLATPSSEHATATASRRSGGKADRSSGSRGSTRETTTTTRSGGINERDPALEKLRSFIKARLNEGKEGGGEAGAAAEAGAGVKRCGCRMPCNCAAASRGTDGAGAGTSGASMAMSGDGSGVGDEGAVPGQWGMLGPVYTAALKDDDGNDDGADLRHSVKVGADKGEEAAAAHDTPPPPPPMAAADAHAEECPVCLGRSPSLCDLENQMEQKNSVAAEIESKPLTMCVAHYVRWELTLDFEAWIQDMFDTMSTFPVRCRVRALCCLHLPCLM